ncbi:PAS domain-containing protein [Salmonella enterica]|uniref:PAS domain-containing protein n=1 Tax=Salmonella enterica TaxID=28901 RepID=UPI0019A260FE|nr:PAS domain S-box protein [Salmonella enterica]MDL2989070.1 PAS domain S-box protein [Salmonella enterica]HAK6771629.1 PAS domain S-box protein [Salmonella enterica]
MGGLSLQLFLKKVNEAIIISDSTGVITYYNPAAARLFGFKGHESVGESLNIIIPEKYRQSHWVSYFETMRTGITKYVATLLHVPALKRDGSTISIAFTVTQLPGDNNMLPSIVAIIRDETARFNEERQLRKRLSLLESQSSSSE